ncbi:hypothetical protein K0C01_02920 [Salinarchaeum sp. IM2453]|uniref:hypothetical protein n=1 Tax=Salinarchaeum sp. IM2453 TaxID=2862870 RepID=UPI001C83E036|nr:hypothetical protein [Salinarchaeum sp. IM2453]QZA89121.1 hypothetical protein K0C01_02920 [Salinarchaeum sp. IM2453]
MTVINQDGEIYLWDGRYRLAIAQLLDLDVVPVHVVCRHEEWQHLRDSFFQNQSNTSSLGSFSDLRAHPDMQDVINSF